MILSRTTKRAAAVAAVLFELFRFIGPPAILQSDNGREFSNQASDSKQMSLDDDIRDRCVSSKCLCSQCNSLTSCFQFIDEVILEIRKLWLECRIVRGSPRRSTTNGGVDRFNRTMEEKLGAWMKDNNSTCWSVGCRIVCWRYNTQVH